MKNKILLFTILVLVASVVFADGAIIEASNQVLNVKYVQIFQNRMSAWQGNATSAATTIFWKLWAINTAYRLALDYFVYKVPDLYGMVKFYTVRAILAGLFTAVFVNPEVYMSIIKFFGQYGGITGGGSIGIEPGYVLNQYSLWYKTIYTPALDKLDWYQFGMQFSYGSYNMIYVICSVIIAILVIVLQAEIMLGVYGGIVLTGFAGSEWTMDWWRRYVAFIVALGVQLFIFCGLYLTFKSTFTPSTDVGDIFSNVIFVIITTALLFFLPITLAALVHVGTNSAPFAAAGGAAIGALAKGGNVGKSAMDAFNFVAGKSNPLRGGGDDQGGGKNPRNIGAMDEIGNMKTTGNAGNKQRSNNDGAIPKTNAPDKADFLSKDK